MEAAALEYTQNRMEVSNDHFKNIQRYGENNDYPQSVVDIVAASVTGTACLIKYIDFVYGKGFADADTYQVIVNEEGETLDDILHKIVGDYCQHGGFALHINRNLLGQITSLRHIPVLNVRFGANDLKEYKNKYALYDDWGNRKKKLFNQFKDKIEYIDRFTPDREEFLQHVLECEGGITQYKGEIYYYSNRGDGNYPIPIFDGALTDMCSQEAMSNITYRGSKRAFLPGLILAEINQNYDPTNEEDKKNFERVNEELKKMQGDKNTASMLHIVVANKDEIPQAVPLRGFNYDKDFTVSRDSCRMAIGQAFMQPAELRCEDSSKGFSNDTMEQAYKVYNSTTENHRLCLERIFASLFKLWWQPINLNFQIQPLSYSSETLLSQLGEKAKDVVEIAKDNTIPLLQRKAILMNIYNLDEDVTNKILLISKQE